MLLLELLNGYKIPIEPLASMARYDLEQNHDHLRWALDKFIPG